MVAGMMTNRGAAEERTDRQLAARQRTADRGVRRRGRLMGTCATRVAGQEGAAYCAARAA